MKLISLLFLILLSLYAKERIVTMSPAITEIVFGLGSGAEVIGVSNYADFPKEVRKLPKVGGYFHPSLEKILLLNPTLVIGNKQDKGFLAKVKAFGIETLSVELKTLSSIKRSIKEIALKVGKEAEILNDKIDQAIAKAESHQLAKKPKVLIIFGARLDLQGSIYIAGHDIFFEEIITACGGTNAFSEAFMGQPALHYEGLIETNPDIVIILYSKLTNSVDKEEIYKLWDTVPITASHEKRIHILDGDYISIPSQRVANTVGDICEVIQQ